LPPNMFYVIFMYSILLFTHYQSIFMLLRFDEQKQQSI